MTNPVNDDLEQWFKETAHQIESLMAVTNIAQNALISGDAAVRSAAAVIRTAAVNGQHWLVAHPCPDRALGQRFQELFERYAAAADRFELGSNQRVMADTPDLAHELGSLGRELTDFIAAVQRRLEAS